MYFQCTLIGHERNVPSRFYNLDGWKSKCHGEIFLNSLNKYIISLTLSWVAFFFLESGYKFTENDLAIKAFALTTFYDFPDRSSIYHSVGYILTKVIERKRL